MAISRDREILDMKAAFMPMFPFWELVKKPRDIYDVYTTTVGDVYNTLLRFARVNQTTMFSSMAGQCVWINNTSVCTGIYGQLMSNEVDFSSVPLDFTDSYDHGDLFSPLYIPSVVSPVEFVFISTPQTLATRAVVNPAKFLELPWEVLILHLLALISIIVLINWRFQSRDKRITILDAFVLQTEEWSRTFKTNHRRIIVLFSLLYVFSFNMYYFASMGSDLVVSIPARYPETLEDILNFNRTPIFFKDLNLAKNFRESNDSIERRLYKLAEESETLYAMEEGSINLPLQVQTKNAVAFILGRSAAEFIKAGMCMPVSIGDQANDINAIPKVKTSNEFGQTMYGFAFSPKSSHRLRKRLQSTLFWAQDLGFLDKVLKVGEDAFSQIEACTSNPRFGTNLINCMFHMNNDNEPIAPEPVVTIQMIEVFIKLWTAGMLFSLAVFSLEKFACHYRKDGNNRGSMVGRLLEVVIPHHEEKYAQRRMIKLDKMRRVINTVKGSSRLQDS